MNFYVRTLERVEHKPTCNITLNGQDLIDFSSNDYLGLKQHPVLKEAFIEGIHRYGVGAGASQLIGGSTGVYNEVEALLAEERKTESALLLSSGFQANSTLLPVLADRHSTIFADRLSHRSILSGAQLSRAKLVRYRHADYLHLEELLSEERKKDPRKNIVIATESLFGMDGDVANLKQLSLLAEKYRADLYIDDAHAMGVLGPKGMGLTDGMDKVRMSMGTFGKGLGVFGAFVSCSADLRNKIINQCPGFIFSTALPSALVYTIKIALSLVLSMNDERKLLQQTAQEFREKVQTMGFDTGSSSSHIIPLIVREEEKALHLSQWLRSQGIYAYPIHPPTVPKGGSRIRIGLSRAHSHRDIEKLLAALKKWG